MTNEKPILFSGEMVRAILEGRKTQTRRVMVPADMPDNIDLRDAIPEKRNQYEFLRLANGDEFGPVSHRYGRPGTLLWVRETWAVFAEHYNYECGWESEGLVTLASYKERPRNNSNNRYDVCYRADGYEAVTEAGEHWRPSIFMPRWASRITLRVTDVRVERVQDISEDDAVAEGCTGYETYHRMPGEPHLLEPYDTFSPSDEFSQLWDHINAKRGYGWNVNPWVWVVTFEVV